MASLFFSLSTWSGPSRVKSISEKTYFMLMTISFPKLLKTAYLHFSSHFLFMISFSRISATALL